MPNGEQLNQHEFFEELQNSATDLVIESESRKFNYLGCHDENGRKGRRWNPASHHSTASGHVKEVLILVTSQSYEDLSTLEVMDLYRLTHSAKCKKCAKPFSARFRMSEIKRLF